MDAAASARWIDLHTHILPAIDDGAADWAEAIAMARCALADGIVHLVATPHNLRWPPGTDQRALTAQVAELTERLVTEGLPLRIALGAEMALIPALPHQIDAGEAIPLNCSRYLLLELPYTGLPPQLEEIISQVQVRGLVPILAHPERNIDLQRHPERLRRLVEGGLLSQVTAASLEGRFGRPAQHTAERLLAENLVHVLASDAHDPRARAPRLSKARALAAEIIGPEQAEALVSTIPAAILADQPVAVEPPRPPRPRRWFWPRPGQRQLSRKC